MGSWSGSASPSSWGSPLGEFLRGAPHPAPGGVQGELLGERIPQCLGERFTGLLGELSGASRFLLLASETRNLEGAQGFSRPTTGLPARPKCDKFVTFRPHASPGSKLAISGVTRAPARLANRSGFKGQSRGGERGGLPVGSPTGLRGEFPGGLPTQLPTGFGRGFPSGLSPRSPVGSGVGSWVGSPTQLPTGFRVGSPVGSGVGSPPSSPPRFWGTHAFCSCVFPRERREAQLQHPWAFGAWGLVP